MRSTKLIRATESLPTTRRTEIETHLLSRSRASAFLAPNRILGILGILLYLALLYATVNTLGATSQSITIAWDPSSSPDIVGYKVYYGGASGTYTNSIVVGNVTTNVIPALTSGASYFLSVTAYDANGKESLFSEEISYTVPSASVPTIALSAPLDGANYTAPATIALAASVTSNGHTITKVQFYNGATLLGESTSAPYSWSWSNVGAGSWPLSAVLVYDSGSTLTSAVANVTVANPPPTVVLTAPSDGAMYTAPASINLSVSATSNGHSISKVQFYNGATLLGETSSAPYSWAWSGVGAGSYVLSAVLVYDSGSTLSSSSANVTVTSPSPTIALTAPVGGTGYSAPATVNLAASVISNGHSITKVQFYNGATLLGEDTAAPYTWTWSSVAVGSYSPNAVLVYDSGSTLASSSASITVTNPLPTIALTAPIDGSGYTAPATIGLAATVTANGHIITKVQFYNGATLLGSDSSSPYSYSWKNVVAGNYSVTARVVYDSGSTITSTLANVAVTNLAPTLALTGPLNGAGYLAPATINLAASVTANGNTITKVQFFNGAALLGEDTASPYSWTWSNVNAGSYALSAVVVYGSSSTLASSIANVTVTNPLPVIALTVPADGANYTAPATIGLSAGVTANGHSITKVQFYNGATLLGESASYPYNWTWTGVNAGSYSLGAVLVYDAGNILASSLANVVVSNPPPNIALTAPLDSASYMAPATINLAASATANGHLITKVQFYNGGALLGETSSAPYSFGWNSVAAGSYGLTAVLVYDSGTTLASLAANVTVTNPPPTIVLTAPLDGTNYIAPATINLGANVTTNGHSITKVQFYNGPVLLGEDSSTPYQWTWTNASAGSYSVAARAVYDSGSTVDSLPANVAVTNPPPTLALISPVTGAQYRTPATIDLAANVAANGHSITKVQFYDGTTLLGESASAPYSFVWTGAAPGSYSLTAQVVYDSGTALGSSAANIDVTGPPAPPGHLHTVQIQVDQPSSWQTQPLAGSPVF